MRRLRGSSGCPTPDLAPLCDVVCTAAYPRLTKKLAMAIGGRNVPYTIHLEHWWTLVPETRGARRVLENELGVMAERVGRVAGAREAESRAP